MNGYPKNITEFKNKLDELGVSSRQEYVDRWEKLELPYMPSVEYKDEWSDNKGWNFIFSNNGKKKIRTPHVVLPIFHKIRKPVSQTVVVCTQPTSILGTFELPRIEEKQILPGVSCTKKLKDDCGYWKFIELIKVLDKLNINTLKSYQLHAQLCSACPLDPKEYYDISEETLILYPYLKSFLIL